MEPETSEGNAVDQVQEVVEQSRMTQNQPDKVTDQSAEQAAEEQQLAEVPTPAEEEDEGIYLGDYILITSETYGTVAGRIYYIDEDLIRVLPKGVSNRLYDFPIVNDEIDPDLGITNIKLRAGQRTSFVLFQGFREKQLLDAYSKTGEKIGKYTIVRVNAEEDSIVLTKDGEETNVEFGYHGIPRDLPFSILQIAPMDVDLFRSEGEGEGEVDTAADLEAETEDIYEDIGDITVPIYVPIKERESKDMTYSEVEQKGDLLSQFISMLDGPSQKNPLYLKRLRSMVEVFSTMKNMIIRRDDAGEVRGENPVSYTYLADMLQKGSVPLSRPVLRTKRTLFVDAWEDDEMPDNRIIDKDDYTIQLGYYDLQKSIQADAGAGAITDSTGQTDFYRTNNENNKRYPLGQQFIGNTYTFKKDSEFFRNSDPMEPVEGFRDLRQGVQGGAFGKKKTPTITEADLTLTPQIIRRGISNTYGKDDQIIYEADRADIENYMLFPLQASASIGSTRTGKLYEDIQRASVPSKTMKTLLETYGGSSDIADPSKILALKPDNDTLANIPFESYFEQILKLFHPRGQGDLYHILSDIGMTNVELTSAQSQVFMKRVDAVITKYRRIITQLRQTKPVEAPEAGPILPSFIARLQAIIESHEPLRVLAKKMSESIPNYKNVDIAHVAYMLIYAQDYFLAALSKDDTSIQREMVRVARDEFLQKVREAQAIKRNSENRGFPPRVNPCRHVKELDLIRKIKDDGDRLALLARFITLYQAGRRENWVICNVCNKDLICHHELLQVQQFLHPREHESIQKQIILHFAGGRYGNNHICRNCGKPISTLDYDNHIEFDDEGRPMMGRSELVDEDEIEKEKIEFALGTPEVRTDQIQFDNPDQFKIYSIARQICERVGVFPNPEDYRQIVTKSQEEYNEFAREKTLEAYKKAVASSRGKGSAEQQIQLQYFEIMTIHKISIVACCTLLKIQTVMPEYNVRYTLPGCDPGFKGYPLDQDESLDNSVGLKYIACAITGMPANKEPWQNTVWMRENSIPKRQDKILASLKLHMPRISDDAISQSLLEKKRKYLVDIYGKDAVKARVSEKIRATYKPYISSAFKQDADAVTHGAIRSAASGSIGEAMLANKYIHTLHDITKQHAEIVLNSPYANASCCMTPIDNPGEFMETKGGDLATYLPRQHKLARATERQQWAFFPYQTRIPVDIRAEVQLELAHRVFLSLCYQGDRKGLPHELGHDFTCDWCGIRIMREYYFPDMVLNKKGVSVVEEISDDTLRQHVVGQIGEITRERLDDLLAAAHKRTLFTFYTSAKPFSKNEFIQRLQTLQPPPVDDWQTHVEVTLANLAKLGPKADSMEVARALGHISSVSSNAKNMLRGFFQRDATMVIETLDALMAESPMQIMEVLRSYFLINFQRIQGGHNPAQVLLPKEYDLSRPHREELNNFLQSHHSIVKEISWENVGDVGKNKMDYYISQLASIMTFFSEIKKSHIPYGALFLREIMEVFVYCPLANLLDMNSEPTQTPSMARIRGGEGPVFQELKKYVLALLQKYRRESLAYNLETIKLEVAKANERDRKAVLSRMDRLNDEQRKASVVKRLLGIGEWADMAGKGVWKYDKDYDEMERLTRERDMEHRETGIQEAHDTADAGYDNRNHQEDGVEE